ncbi:MULTISPECIES: HEPN domain-containing protein [Staphylococcus]|nr:MULTISPECIES: HEPN domain-containing protein [Staphylococcus]
MFLLDKIRIKEEFNMLKKEKYVNECFKRKGNSKLITFKYLLPFKIPINEFENIDFINEENTFIIFNHLEDNVLENDNIKRDRKTYVEITSIIKHNQFKKLKSNSTSRESKKSNSLTEIFNKQFNCLNNLIKIISVKYQYHNIYQLSLGDILSIPYYVIYTTDGNIKEMSIFMIDLPGKIEEDQYSSIKKSDLLNIKKNYNVFNNHPSNIYVLAMRKGERSFYKSDYNLAIVQIQTALEVFITNFLERYYKLDENLSDEEIKKKLGCGYANVVNDHLLKTIDNLNLDNFNEIKNCVKKYMKDYYDMRNKIVHTGATYKKEDAIEFKEIVADIIRLITFGMKNKSYSDFSKEFNIYNIINKKIDINEIKNKYKKSYS